MNNEADFGHDGPYYIDDSKRSMHHRIIKQRGQERFQSHESADAIFMTIG